MPPGDERADNASLHFLGDLLGDHEGAPELDNPSMQYQQSGRNGSGPRGQSQSRGGANGAPASTNSTPNANNCRFCDSWICHSNRKLRVILMFRCFRSLMIWKRDNCH